MDLNRHRYSNGHVYICDLEERYELEKRNGIIMRS